MDIERRRTPYRKADRTGRDALMKETSEGRTAVDLRSSVRHWIFCCFIKTTKLCEGGMGNQFVKADISLE